MVLQIAGSTGWMLPYDGMTRTGSKGVSHSAIAETPSEGRKVLEIRMKHKLGGAIAHARTGGVTV